MRVLSCWVSIGFGSTANKVAISVSLYYIKLKLLSRLEIAFLPKGGHLYCAIILLMFCRETWQCDKCRELRNEQENTYYAWTLAAEQQKHETEKLKSFHADKANMSQLTLSFSRKIDIYSLTSYHRMSFASVWCFSPKKNVCWVLFCWFISSFNYDPIHHILILIPPSSIVCVSCQQKIVDFFSLNTRVASQRSVIIDFDINSHFSLLSSPIQTTTNINDVSSRRWSGSCHTKERKTRKRKNSFLIFPVLISPFDHFIMRLLTFPRYHNGCNK